MPLKTKTVGIYTCSQMGALQETRLRLFMKKYAPIESEDADEIQAHADTHQEWAYIAACTDPFLPFADYLQIPTLELNEIREAVAEVNDDMVKVGERITAEQAKKKSKSKPQKSTSGSES